MNRLYLLLLVSYLPATCWANIVSSTDARLPMSLSTVISDLEAEGRDALTTACFLTSRSVTQQQQATLQETLLGTTDIEVGSKVVGTDAGIALCRPESNQEVASTAIACGGIIVYYPSATDLSRGEGLFDTLAPAMEKILASEDHTGCLHVIVEGDRAQTQAALERAVEPVLANLVTDQPVSVLRDVFDEVLYVSPSEALGVLTSQRETKAPADAASLVASVVAADSSLWPVSSSSQLSVNDLAAARTLGPAARVQVSAKVQGVQKACLSEDGTIKLVPNFGELCDAAIDQALEELDKEAEDTPNILKSTMGKQIQSSVVSQLCTELGSLLEDQLVLLQQASFEEFNKGLSKLIISPNLASDMDEAAKKSIAAFAKSAKKLVAKKSDWSAQAAKQTYATKLKDHCANRLLAAQASGQFKPLPRKGVTVGLHWLLPKPFGNDFRQEPWMVHATDNMVYIPKDKITDVSPEEAGSGDWRRKIVPSPVGNDMLYMQ